MFFLTGWAIPFILIAVVGSVPTASIPEPAQTFGMLISSPTPTPTLVPTSTPTPSPSPVPTSTPTPTLTPTKTPITKTPSPLKSEQVESTIPPTGDIGLMLMKQINDFRAGKGLPAFITDGYTCGFAVTRASEITSNFSHDGFRSRIDNKSLPYPSFTGVSENIAMNSDPNAVVQGWIDSPGHNENLSKPHAHACVAKNGNYYVFLSWNP